MRYLVTVIVLFLLGSCTSIDVIHSTKMEVINIDYKNQTVLMRGHTIRPKGFYYAVYPLECFGYLEDGMVFELKNLSPVTERMHSGR